MPLLYLLFQRAHGAAIDARRRASTAGYLGWAALASLTLGLSLAVLLAFATQLWLLGMWIVALTLLGGALVPALAPWLLRHVLVPGGHVKAAFYCGRFSVVAGTDPQAFALVAAAWAAAGASGPVSGEAIAWLQEKRDQRGALGDAEIVATAFTLARSDLEAARQLLCSVREMVELHPAVRELAGEWLAVDAAERGAWEELLPTATTTAGWPATPLRFFLEGVATARKGHASAPNSFGLHARWLLAPYRRHTFELLRIPPAATAASSKQAGQKESTGDAAAGDAAADAKASAAAAPATSLEEAVALHVTTLGAALGAAPDAAGVHRLAASWDRALTSPETTAWLERRATELGAQPGAAARAAGEIMEAVASELRATIERQRLPAPPPLRSRFGQLLGAKLRHGRLDELELQFTRWAERVDTGAKLRPIDEWREFLAVRAAYRDVVESGGEDLRRLAFPHAFNAANRAAVALWNRRDEYAMAHAILAWELEEARLVGDSAALELAAKNAALKFNTRTGRHE